jgi:hypothetical protein
MATGAGLHRRNDWRQERGGHDDPSRRLSGATHGDATSREMTCSKVFEHRYRILRIDAENECPRPNTRDIHTVIASRELTV